MASPIKIRLVGDTTGFTRSLNGVKGIIAGLAPAGQAGMFGPLAAAAGVAGASILGVVTQVGQALADLGIQGVQDFAEYDTQVRRIANLFPDMIEEVGLDETLKRIGGIVSDTAQEFGFGTNDVADALYNASSATGDLAASQALLQQGAQGARVEGTELNTVVGTLTTRMSAFGLSIDETGAAADSYATSIRVGRLDAQAWAVAAGTVAGTANELGLEFWELDAALAQYTTVQPKAEKAATGLNSAFLEMLDPTTDISKAFQDMTGKTIPDFLDAGGSMEDVISNIDAFARAAGVGMTELFQTREAGVAFLSLTGDGFTELQEKLDATANSTGALAAGWEIAADAPQVTLDRFQQALHDLSLTIGEALVPFLETATPLIQEFIDGLGPDASTLFSDLGQALADAVPAMVEMAQAWLDLWPAVRPLIPVFSAVVQALAWLLQPLNLLKVALGVITGILAVGVASFVAIGLAIRGVVGWVSDLVGVDVSGWLGGMVHGLSVVAGWFRDLGSNVWGWITGAASFFLDAGGAIGGWFLDKLAAIADWFLALPGQLWGWISASIGTVWEVGKNLASAVFENLGGIGDWFRNLPGNIWSWISEKISDLWQAGKNIASEIGGGLWEGIKEAINSVIRLWNRIDLPFQIDIPKKKVLGVTVFPGFKFGIADLLPDIPELAKGGMVSSPTLAMIGESGPEAVVPLDRMPMGNTVNVTVNVDGFVGNEAELGEAVVGALSQWTRTNGALDLNTIVRR